VLAALFAWTLPRTPAWKPVPPPGALVVAVTGHLWWWDVSYRDAATGAEIRTANEIRIPTGRPVYLALDSADVIHSFWVPELAGKMDMVPGRLQHLLVSAERWGIFRGQCAEFCGEQHARMALHVVAVAPAAFDRWLAAQAGPARAPATPRQEAGRDAFLANRCDACHAVRGLTADARLGPDLTHVGGRMHLAAGTLPNTGQGRAAWIAHVQSVKSGARMPSYGGWRRRRWSAGGLAGGAGMRRAGALPNAAAPAGELEALQRAWRRPRAGAGSRRSTTRTSASTTSAPRCCSSCWPACWRC
jgi:cytochrome c oxidase subunit 2